jgi:hypothetical protein
VKDKLTVKTADELIKEELIMWLKKESDNYIFHYRPDSLAEEEIDQIIEYQEECCRYICNVLDVDLKMKLKYYFCDSREEVGQIYGDNEPGSGFTRMPNEIYAVYNENIKCIGYHEDAHIISYTIARPEQNFIREGLSMFFDKTWWGVANLAWAKYFYGKESCPSIGDMMVKEKWIETPETIGYTVSGAFAEFLITSFGIEKYKELYRQLSADFRKAILGVYQLSIEELEQEFIGYLDKVMVRDEIFDLIEDLIQKYN